MKKLRYNVLSVIFLLFLGTVCFSVYGQDSSDPLAPFVESNDKTFLLQKVKYLKETVEIILSLLTSFAICYSVYLAIKGDPKKSLLIALFSFSLYSVFLFLIDAI